MTNNDKHFAAQVRAAMDALLKMDRTMATQIVLIFEPEKAPELVTTRIVSTTAPLRAPPDDALQIARGALADIANSEDMTLELARKKAARIYAETEEEQHGT